MAKGWNSTSYIFNYISHRVPPAFEPCPFLQVQRLKVVFKKMYRCTHMRVFATRHVTNQFPVWVGFLTFFQICSVIGFPSSTQCLRPHSVACVLQNCEDHNNQQPANIHTLTLNKCNGLQTYISDIFTYCSGSMQSVAKEKTLLEIL